MSVAELEENEVIEDEVTVVEEVDEVVDNDQTDVVEALAEESSDEENSEVEEEADGIDISFDGESLTPENDEEEKEAKPWVKELRKAHKDTQKENRELKRRLEEQAQAQPQEPQVGDPGPKPTLEDFDYESAPYEEAIDKWYTADREFQEVRKSQEVEEKRQADDWQSRLNEYETEKTKLKANGVKDFEDAEDAVSNMLSQTQRGIIVQGSENPALSFYALGKNPKMAQELANITDAVKFAFAVSKMENKLKTTKRKARTAPESTLKSSGGSGGKDNTLERLRAEADKTGDRTKVNAYRMKLRRQN